MAQTILIRQRHLNGMESPPNQESAQDRTQTVPHAVHSRGRMSHLSVTARSWFAVLQRTALNGSRSDFGFEAAPLLLPLARPRHAQLIQSVHQRSPRNTQRFRGARLIPAGLFERFRDALSFDTLQLVAGAR